MVTAALFGPADPFMPALQAPGRRAENQHGNPVSSRIARDCSKGVGPPDAEGLLPSDGGVPR